MAKFNPTETMKGEIVKYLKSLRYHPLSSTIREVRSNDKIHKESLYSTTPISKKDSFITTMLSLSSPEVDRVAGALVGLAVADSLGHNFEFEPVRDIVTPDQGFVYPPSSGHHPRGEIVRPLNQFQLLPGQFTDDTSMALCLADSILTCGCLNESDSRCWYWNWWNNGVDNAFRYDDTRTHSVGLGGNISHSIGNVSFQKDCYHRTISHHYEARTEDAGNGSLMRLSPVALRYHSDINKARSKAFESSLATHPGAIAAEACAFLAHLIVRAIHRQSETSNETSVEASSNLELTLLPQQKFLQTCVDEYLVLLQEVSTPARTTLCRLLLGCEEDSSLERCWNWKDDSLMLSRTLGNRGRSYNGYPVSPGYFGAFSLDGLAIAMHCFYHTTTFNEAIVKVVNMFGDADSTGAIVGQIAGAYYGMSAIESAWTNDLRQWDPDMEIEQRAILLYCAGLFEMETYCGEEGVSTMDTKEVTVNTSASHEIKNPSISKIEKDDTHKGEKCTIM